MELTLLIGLVWCVTHVHGGDGVPGFVGGAGPSRTQTCPAGCTCRRPRFAPFISRCSHLESEYVMEKLGNLSLDTYSLHLEDDKLTSLPTGLIKPLHRLKSLHLGYNRFEDLGDFANKLDDVKERLTTLALPYNVITSISGETLSGFNNLEVLDLEGNLMVDLPGEIFRFLPKLQTLNLEGNGIYQLAAGTFLQAQTLQNLVLSGNQLEHVETHIFRGLVNVTNLNLAKNRLSELPPEVFHATPKLASLNLEKNRFSSLPTEAIAGLKHLMYLYLSGNQIVSIPAEMNRWSSVQYLYLHENRISKVDPTALDALDNLTALWLYHNELTSLPERWLSRFLQMKHGELLRVGENPFRCDCQLVWFARWLRHQAVISPEAYPPRCDTPSGLYNFTVRDLPLSEMTCSFSPITCSSDDTAVPECKALRATCQLDISEQVSSALASKSSCLCSGQHRSCYVCPAGSYGVHTTERDSVCTSCPAFETSWFGSQQRSECFCMAGYQRNEDGVCEACALHYYKPGVGEGKCRSCPEGSQTYYDASTSCYCRPGYTLNKHQQCQACPENTFKEGIGSRDCRHCWPHSVSPQASSNMSLCRCIYGKYRQEAGRIQQRCQSYKHQEEIELGLRPKVLGEPVQGVLRASDIQVEVGACVGSVALVSILLVLVVIFLRRRRAKDKFKQAERHRGIDRDVCENLVRPLTSATGMDDIFVTNDIYSRYKMSACRLELGPSIGHGAFGQVYLAQLQGLMTGDKVLTVAVKTLRDLASSEEEEALKVELNQMVFVGQHPNIISLIGACTQGRLMIVMEYAAHGNLLHLLVRMRNSHTNTGQYGAPADATPPENPEGSQSPSDDTGVGDTSPGRRSSSASSSRRQEEEGSSPEGQQDPPSNNDVSSHHQLMSFAWQIAKGMEHIALMKCIHRDLAARNVLLSNGGVAKICDFGLAREVYESGYYFKSSKGRLPFKWMSPEALLTGHYTTKSDVWSFGVLLWEMATFGSTPYPGIPADAMINMLNTGYRMPKPHGCSQRFYDVIKSCWQASPIERPSFRELVLKFDRIVQDAAEWDYLELGKTGEEYIDAIRRTSSSRRQERSASGSAAICSSGFVSGASATLTENARSDTLPVFTATDEPQTLSSDIAQITTISQVHGTSSETVLEEIQLLFDYDECPHKDIQRKPEWNAPTDSLSRKGSRDSGIINISTCLSETT